MHPALRGAAQGASAVRRLPVVADCGTTTRLQRSLCLWSRLSSAAFEQSRYSSGRIPAVWSWSGRGPVSPASDLTTYRPDATMSAGSLFAQILGILSKTPFHMDNCVVWNCFKQLTSLAKPLFSRLLQWDTSVSFMMTPPVQVWLSCFL